MKKLLLIIWLSLFFTACTSMQSDLNLDFTNRETLDASLIEVQNSFETDEEKEQFDQGLLVITLELMLEFYQNNDMTITDFSDFDTIQPLYIQHLQQETKGKSIKDIQDKAADMGKILKEFELFFRKNKPNTTPSSKE